ncbi:hypothetical protein BKA65DRAFT_510388 [Rhexocercosporidium sp. MPI-PUGE-AT-0058]|nr:hypothetical protein BKA65DRAFT_510388 [Rhexocercosporidium sp. MPI-PUGE-AT-0058]
MASREDRIQARLRGAQRRDIKEVDFSLTFAIPPADPSPIINRPQDEPLLELHPQRSTRRTPARPPPSVSVATQDVTRSSQSTNDANTSAKRRKLDTDILPSSQSTRSQPPRRDIYEIQTEQDGEPEQDSSILEPAEISVDQNVVSQDPGGPPNTSLLEVADNSDELGPATELLPASISSPIRPARNPSASQTFDEVTESPKNAPGSGRRQRVAVGSTLQSSSQLQEVQNADLTATPVTRDKRKRGNSVSKPSPEIRPSQTPSAVDEIDELSPEQPIRRGRRPKIVEESVPDADIQEEEEAEAISDEEAAATLKKNRGRRTSKRFAAASPDLDALLAGSTMNDRRPRKRNRAESSPVLQRHPKNAVSKPQAPKKTAKKAAKKLQVPVGGPVPVTVHRLTLPPLYDENESDADILNAEMPHMKRSGVNAIDVLSQVCQEIIGLHMNSLEQMGNNCEDSASRREYKTRWNAVEAFGKELQLRLLTQTINLDNAYSLERRVRDELKKKNSLREEVLRIRKEREQVALRMDEIRMKHEREKTDAQNRDDLNIAIHDMEMVIEMGKSRQTSETNRSADMVGTELLIRRIAGEVSNKGGSGGTLSQIKEFNAFLERAALALEARKV